MMAEFQLNNFSGGRNGLLEALLKQFIKNKAVIHSGPVILLTQQEAKDYIDKKGEKSLT